MLNFSVTYISGSKETIQGDEYEIKPSGWVKIIVKYGKTVWLFPYSVKSFEVTTV